MGILRIKRDSSPPLSFNTEGRATVFERNYFIAVTAREVEVAVSPPLLLLAVKCTLT